MVTNQPQGLSRQYLEDEKWINDHIMELTQRCPDQWVAVLKGEVVAAGTDLGLVQTEGRRRAKEAHADQCVYSFVEAGIRIYRAY